METTLHRALSTLTLLGGLLLCAQAAAAPPAVQTLDGGWQFRLQPHDAQAAAHAAATRWHAATVPGSVQTDLLADRLIADPYVGAAEAGLQWIGLGDWVYRTRFDADPVVMAHRHQTLVFHGLDTYADVRLNGHALLHADNMFRTWRVPVDGLLHAHGNTLEVVLHSPIRRWLPRVEAMATPPLPGEFASAFGDEPPDVQTANYVRKAAYQYGWDWGPRYVELGIWQPVELQAWDGLRLADFHIDQQRVTAQAATLGVQLDIRADQPGDVEVTVDYHGPDGSAFADAGHRLTLKAGRNRVTLPLTIAHPARWFPVGYGTPSLYTFHVRIRDAQGVQAEATRMTGLRSIELRRTRDADGRGFALIVNGIPIFAKGANVIPFDMFPARVTDAQRRRVLQSAVDAHMNLVRVWGGGIYPDDAFFAMADRLGLMVWQDFAFGGAVPPAYDADFRANVRAEARDQLLRLRDHPSLVLWCGNNEIETSWANWGSGAAMKKADPAFARRVWDGYRQLFGHDLRDLVATLGNGVPYWSSTPGTDLTDGVNVADDGDMHGWDVWAGSAPITDYLKTTPRFMSEFGLQSLPSLRTLRTVMTPADMHLGSPVLRAHQKFDHGNGNQRLLHYIRDGYGEPRDFPAFVYLSQVMQAEGIELEALHLRGAMPRTMGALYWQLNDVWPGASWSSIDWYGRWKALQFHARRFYAPLLVAPVRRDGVTDVHLVSDRTTPVTGAWRVRVMDFDGHVHRDDATPVTLPPLSSTAVARFRDADLLRGADPRHTVAVFELTADGAVVSRHCVYFAAARAIDWPDPGLHVELQGIAGHYTLTLQARRLARAVWIDFGDIDATLSDNALTVLPGETVTLHVDSDAGLAALRDHLHLRSLHGATRPLSSPSSSASTAAASTRPHPGVSP